MTPPELMAKAHRALESAALLLEAGDAEGACNRAYYSMFDAARAALALDGADQPGGARSHSGLIAAFSLHWVKSGRFPVTLGRALNRAQELRLVADYTGDPIPNEKAREMVGLAREFVRHAASLAD